MPRFSPRVFCLATLLTTVFQADAGAATYPHFWSQRFGDASFQAVNGVTTDGNGNVYVIGTFDGTINLGGSNLNSAGSNDIFVAKFSPAGVHQWSMRFGDTFSQEGRGIVAATNGEFVITGHFEGTISIPGFPLLISAGATDIYLARFTTDGFCIWNKRFGDATYQYSSPIAIDNQGGVVIASAFLGTVNFGGSNLVSVGSYDIYVARFNSGGGHSWSKRFGDVNWQDATCVAIDANFNVFIGGHFDGTFSFGGADVTGATDVYVVKLDPTGAHVWSKDFGDGAGQYCNSIALDKNANVFITGYLDGTINFGGSDLIGTGDCFLAKFNSAGTHQWSKRFGLDANPQDGRGVATDAGGNVILAGHFVGQIDLGGGPLQFQGTVDLFLGKFNGAGDHMWSRPFGNSLTQQIPCVTVDSDDSIVYAGQFDGTLNFGGSSLVSAGGTDAFVAKLGGDTFEPTVTSILDIGNDQGGKVKIRFVRSGTDASLWPAPVVRYDAFRRDDAPPASAVKNEQRKASDRGVLVDGWTQVGSVSAYTDNTYGIDVPTIGDSTIAAGQYHSVFFIRAATAAPGTFYDSPPDSGYSLDNLAPGIPTGFFYVSGQLVWNGSGALDFDYFSVYGGDTNSFGSSTLIAYTTDNQLNVGGSQYAHYFVTATDFSGNESGVAVLDLPTGVEGTPRSYVLSVSAYPNPFNPQTTIRYTVPSKGHVDVSIYDLRGGHVATIVDEEKDAGSYTRSWDGKDDRGASVGSGMYFARVAHPSGTKSYKMVLLK